MIAIILAAATLGLIWGVVFVRRSGLVGGCLATLGIGSCLGHPFFHVSVITLDRLFLALLAVLYVGYRRFAGLAAKPIRRTDIALLGFLGVLSASTLLGDWRLDGGQPLATLLFFYMMPAAVYWIGSRCELAQRSQKWILLSFAGFGVYLSVTAVFEVLGISAVVFPRYIMDAGMVEFLGRGRGPYLNPIGNGVYINACLIATLLLWPHLDKKYRPLIVGAAILCCVGMLCTLTRSVWLGAGLSVVAIVALTVPWQYRVRVLVAAGILGVSAALLLGNDLLTFKRDKHVSASEMAESAKLRPILAAFAYEMFWDHPWMGVGFGQYQQHNIDYLTRRSFDLPMHRAANYVQHNTFLSLLTETGLLGVGAFSLLVCFWLADGWKLWHDPSRFLWQRQLGLLSFVVLLSFLVNAMFHETSLIPMLNMLVFFLTGICTGILNTELRALN